MFHGMLRLMNGIIKGPDEDSSRNQVRLGCACRQLGSTNGHFSAHCRGYPKPFSPILNRKLCIQLTARRPGSVHQDEPPQAKAKTAAVACADALSPADAGLFFWQSGFGKMFLD